MQERFQDLIESIGIWLVYTRSDQRFRCRTCWNPDTQDSPPDCGGCFGTGWQVSLQGVLGVYTNSLTRVRFADAPLTPIGLTAEHTPVVFTRYTDVPQVGDRYLVVEWSQERDQIPFGAQPVRVVEALRVRFVEPQIAGEVVFYMAHCDFVSESRSAYERALMAQPSFPIIV